jgi:predicted ABC-type ATPase
MLIFNELQVNSYFASVVSDFIRHELLKIDEPFTFSFETVMSSIDKVEFLKKAQELGFRTYLYYIATENPAINLERVNGRVKSGGHSVPEDKIIARYYRSLELLFSAIQFTHRAYIFDNSTHEDILLAEITNGKELEAKIAELPNWFKQSVWDKFETASVSN